MTLRRSKVPCGSCRACCKRELLILHPEHGDDPTEYDTQVVINPISGRLVFALRQNAKGECIYLGARGCTIHDRAPAICKEFDCRVMFKRRHKIAKKFPGMIDDLGPVIAAGKRLIKAHRGQR